MTTGPSDVLAMDGSEEAPEFPVDGPLSGADSDTGGSSDLALGGPQLDFEGFSTAGGPGGGGGQLPPFADWIQGGGNLPIEQQKSEYERAQSQYKARRYGIAEADWDHRLQLREGDTGSLGRDVQAEQGRRQPIYRQRHTTVGDVVRDYYHNEAERAEYQRMISRAFGMEDPPTGGWGSAIDPRYNQRWEEAAMAAARTGEPLIPMLEQLGDETALMLDQAEDEQQPRRPDVQLTAQLDLEQGINDVARNELGRELTDDEDRVVRSIISHVHGQERSQQGAMHDVQMTEEGGGEFEQPASAGAMVQEQVEDRFSEEREGYATAQAFIEMMRMVSQGGIA